jgi:predicted PurR-regulated permease PerM
VAAAFIIVAAGMREAAEIIVPFLAAIFIAVVTLPLTGLLVKARLPRWLAAAIVFIGVVAVTLGSATAIITAATAFASELPVYEQLLREKIGAWVVWLQSKGIEITTDQVDDFLDPSQLFPFIQSVLTSMIGLVKSTFFVLLTVVFILLEAAGIPGKMKAISTHPTGDLSRWTTMLWDLQVYLGVKTCTSLSTGVIAGVGCWLLGIPYPIIFGVIAFVLNYVPALGSIIAAIPAIALALLLNGIGNAMLVALLYLLINVAIGSLLEPQIMGRRMGLSPLVVFLSLVFWGFILGPVGMFLSVPLTMIVKILLEGTEDLRWLGVLLGPGGRAAVKTANRSAD